MDKMNREDVLQFFVNLCNNNNKNLLFFSSHAIVNYYGKTIKNHKKIEQLYRYELCESKHHFTNAVECEPIEFMDIFNQTKNLSESDLIECTTSESTSSDSVFKNKVDNENDLNTPPNICLIPKLPELTQGRKFLPFDNDEMLNTNSDTNGIDSNEMKELDITHKTNNNNKRHLDDDGEDNQKQKCIKIANICDESIKSDGCTVNTICSLNNVEKNNFNLNNDNYELGQGDCKMQLNNSYSELMYLEAMGNILHKNSNKNSNDNDENLLKLKLSYRINKKNNNILFCLIIYERVNKNIKTRRNLLNEFKMTEDIDNNVDDTIKDNENINCKKIIQRRNLRF